MHWSSTFEFVDLCEIATGGFGKVFRAKQVGLGGIRQDVILKTPHGKNAAAFAAAAEIMTEEARILAKTKHPNIVRSQGVFFVSVDCLDARSHGQDCEHDRGANTSHQAPVHQLPVLVLEDAGTSLDQVLQVLGGRMDEARAAYIAIELLRGLGCLHEQGIVHRDIKPSNILIGHYGEVKLGDLGIAKDKMSPKDTTKLGGAKGTVYYMSPEALKPVTEGTTRIVLDGRSDIWAVGILLYKLVSGRFPWHVSGNHEEIAFCIEWGRKVEQEHISPLPEEQVSASLFSVIAKCLAKDRGERFHDTAQVIQALQLLAIPSRWHAAQELAHHARSAMEGVPRQGGQSSVTVPVRGGRRSVVSGRAEPELVSVNFMVPLEPSDTHSAASSEHDLENIVVDPEMRSRAGASMVLVRPAGPANALGEVTTRVDRPWSARSGTVAPWVAAAAALLVGTGAWAWRGGTERISASEQEAPAAQVGATGAPAEVPLAAAESQPVHLASTMMEPETVGVSLASVAGPTRRREGAARLVGQRSAVGEAAARSVPDAGEPPLRGSVGSLEVIVLPRGAFVSLDGKPPVTAPVTFPKLREGAHVLRLGLASNAVERTERVRVKRGANRVRIELANPFGSE